MLAAAIATLIIALPFAAAADPIVDCNQTRDATRQLRGCTAYLRFLSADPGNRAVALLNRANIYARDGRYAQALMDYKKARELDPAQPRELLADLQARGARLAVDEDSGGHDRGLFQPNGRQGQDGTRNRLSPFG